MLFRSVQLRSKAIPIEYHTCTSVWKTTSISITNCKIMIFCRGLTKGNILSPVEVYY